MTQSGYEMVKAKIANGEYEGDELALMQSMVDAYEKTKQKQQSAEG